MDRLFGWDLPPGVRLSDPGGPEDPERHKQEHAMEHLGEAFYEATLAGLSVEEINEMWREAAEDAHFVEEEQSEKENEMYKHMDEWEKQREEGT